MGKWQRHHKSPRTPRRKPPPEVERSPKRSGLKENPGTSSKICACSISQHMTKSSRKFQTTRSSPHSIVSDRMKIRGSLARRAIKELHGMGKIKLLVQHSSQMVYTRAIAVDDEEEEVVETKKKGKK